MRKSIAIGFPFFCLLLVVGWIVWRNTTTRETSESHLDVVCQMTVSATLPARHGATTYYFCAEYCREEFVANPGKFIEETCLVCRSEGTHSVVEAGAFPATWEGRTYHFCSDDHRAAFRADPAGQFMHTMWGIPTWLYYVSIALVLVVSFGIFERQAATPTGKAPHRVDLMQWGWLRRILTHRLTRFTAQLTFIVAFLVIIAAGLFGNQLPGKNVAPLLTWTIWWGGLIVLILYLGKAWCYVCPWNAIADWSESLRFWGRKTNGLSLNLKWPRWLRNIWPATILFVGLTWIELGFGVTMNPRFTAWLALGMVGMAFVSAFVFDRRAFCRYGCLVGRVSGLYALFAPVEVRARHTDVCRTCTSKACYRGSAAGEGCPTSEFLGSMQQNTYCISCLECAHTCDQDNVAVNLRPWGADLEMHAKPRSDEAYLALLMLALTGFHGLTMTARWGEMTGWLQAHVGWGELATFSLGMLAIMVLPVAMYAGLVAMSWQVGGRGIAYRDYFIRYAYAVLPIALFYHLAHNSEHLLMEGQKVLALASDPFGWGWNLFGTAAWNPAPLVDLPTLWVIQVFLVLVGHVYSLWIARRTAGALFGDPRAAFRSQIPMLLAMILFSLMSLWLLKQPMQMRTSAM